MKTTGLFFLIGTVAVAGKIPKPDVSIALNFDHDTAEGSLGAAVPKMNWCSGEVPVGGWFDAQGGVESILTNIKQPPATRIWGELKKKFFNNTSDVAIRGDMNANNAQVVDFNVLANDRRSNSAVQLFGSADRRRNNTLAFNMLLGRTSFTPPFGMPGNFALNPRFNLQSNVPDATVEYSCKDTMVKVDVQDQKFTLSKIFGRNQIVPTLSAKTGDLNVMYARDFSGGSKVVTNIKPLAKDIGLMYSHKFPGGSELTTNTKPLDKYVSLKYSRGKVSTLFAPNDSIQLQWSDGGWDATIRAPLEGYLPKDGSGVKFSMKKNLDVSLF